MGLFGFGSKEKDVVDLAERYRQKKERETALAEVAEKKSASGPFSFFDSSEGTSEQETTDSSDSDSPEERKKKLAKRIIDIITRLDDLTNKIYHLQQRIEVLERKADIKIN